MTIVYPSDGNHSLTLAQRHAHLRKLIRIDIRDRRTARDRGEFGLVEEITAVVEQRRADLQQLDRIRPWTPAPKRGIRIMQTLTTKSDHYDDRIKVTPSFYGRVLIDAESWRVDTQQWRTSLVSLSTEEARQVAAHLLQAADASDAAAARDDEQEG